MEYQKIDSIYTKLLMIRQSLDDNLCQIAKSYDFNATELMMYLDVKTHPGTDLNSLCKRLGLKKSAASKALNKLIETGKIKKTTDNVDQRKMQLEHIEIDNQTLCKEDTLLNTFKGLKSKKVDLEKIDKALDSLLIMFCE